MTRQNKIQKSEEQSAVCANDVHRVHGAMQFIAEAFCQCAYANHYKGGEWFAKTTDGMEWSIKFERIEKPKPSSAQNDSLGMFWFRYKLYGAASKSP